MDFKFYLSLVRGSVTNYKFYFLFFKPLLTLKCSFSNKINSDLQNYLFQLMEKVMPFSGIKAKSPFIDIISSFPTMANDHGIN